MVAETAIAKAMDEICSDMYNFRIYNYPPPKMQKGCQIIIGEYEVRAVQARPWLESTTRSQSLIVKRITVLLT